MSLFATGIAIGVCYAEQAKVTTTVASTTTNAMSTTIATTTITTTTTTAEPMIEKDVLVLSTTNGEKQPMVISFNGDYREAEFQFGRRTEVFRSCSIEYKNQFYVFGGERYSDQVNINR